MAPWLYDEQGRPKGAWRVFKWFVLLPLTLLGIGAIRRAVTNEPIPDFSDKAVADALAIGPLRNEAISKATVKRAREAAVALISAGGIPPIEATGTNGADLASLPQVSVPRPATEPAGPDHNVIFGFEGSGDSRERTLQVGTHRYRLNQATVTVGALPPTTIDNLGRQSAQSLGGTVIRMRENVLLPTPQGNIFVPFPTFRTLVHTLSSGPAGAVTIPALTCSFQTASDAAPTAGTLVLNLERLP